MRILVKVGGAQLEEPSVRADLVRSIARARETGHEIVVVHGGGNQIRALVRKLGLSERYHEGLRITDAETADVVLMVLAGLVNKELVRAFQDEDVPAVGLCGADGGTFTARKDKEHGVDLGYVGNIDRVDATLVATLLLGGFVPVIATVARLSRGAEEAADRFYNINADLAVGPLARALSADALLFLTDVEGVLDADRRRIDALTPASCARLREKGVIQGGMIPKVEAALAGLEQCAGALVKIAPAAGEDAVLSALSADVGTRFGPESPEKAKAWTSTS